MTWNEIREQYPHEWLIVEATRAHTDGNQRVLDELAVVEAFESSERAMQAYAARHRAEPRRELYVVHTDRERLAITERRWLGIRLGP